MCQGMIRCALPEIRSGSAEIPRCSSPSISSSSTSGSTTQPAPSTLVLPERIPDGRWRNLNVSPWAMTVWPAFGPPWYRQTRSDSCASRSTILPLPSSPHCAPTITVAGMAVSLTDPAEHGLRRERVLGGREVRELRVALEERQLDRVRRAVPVLREDQLRDPLAVGLVAVVVLVPVDEADQVGVLLDRARLPQVGEDRPLVVPLLDGARELREREDRNLEVASEDLQRARDLRDLLDAVLGRGAGRHQLEVVDDDQPEVGLARLQPPGLRANLHHRDRAGVVDEDRRFHQLVARRREPWPVLRFQLPRAEALRLHARLAAHHPLGHLALRHLEREEGDRDLVPDREVLGHVQRERRLPHRGTRRDDDQVAGLEAGGELVELLEAGWDARHVDPGFVEVHDPLEALLQQQLDMREVARDALLGEVEDDLLGAVDEVRGLAGAVLPQARDLGAGADETAERRHFAHDPRVVRRVRRRGNERRQLVDAGPAADLLELAALLERVDERDRVDGLALLVEGEAGAEDGAVALAVEVLGREDLGHGADRARREQHRAQHRLLRLEVLRRYTWGLRRGGRRGGELGHDPIEAAAADSLKAGDPQLAARSCGRHLQEEGTSVLPLLHGPSTTAFAQRPQETCPLLPERAETSQRAPHPVEHAVEARRARPPRARRC